MKKLKFGIVGLGVGAQHIPGILAHPATELNALCDFDQKVLAETAAKHPGVKTYLRAEDLINDPSIDVVSIASFDQYHATQVVSAFEAGKHVFVEKPICTNEADLERIISACKKSRHLIIGSNLILRKYPRFLELRQRLLSGELGRTYLLEADYNYGRLHKIHHGWRGKENYSVVLGGGIHMVDLSLWLLKEQVEEVYALGSRFCSEGSNFQGNDTVLSMLRYKGGVLGKITANFGCVFPHFHRVALYGTEGSFINDWQQAYYVNERGENPPRSLSDTPYPGAQKSDLISDFIDSILSKGEPPITTDALFHSTAVCLAIDRSAREGQPIKVKQYSYL